MNYKQIYAIKKKNEDKILSYFPNTQRKSGIYVFYRDDETNIKFAYIGQATKSCLTRSAEHLSGYQHIDLSIKKRGFYTEENPYGWKFKVIVYCDKLECDELEKKYILEYSQNGYQLLNKTSGSQGVGKTQIDEYRPKKGYRDGLEQGYINASKDIANLFEKHLNYSQKSDKPNKNQEKAIQKLEEFLNYYKDKKE